MREHDMNNLYHRALLHYSGSVLIVNKELKILFANDETAKMLGAPREKLMKMDMYEVVREGLADSSGAIEALETGRTAMRYIENSDGQGMYVTSVPSFDAQGEIDYIYTYSQDETLANRLLAEMQEKKNRLIQMRSHSDILSSQDTSVIAADPAMQNIYKMAGHLAKTDMTLALLGESGTGKEVLARYIYRNSARKSEEFIPINCAAIPEHLAESEFFGYEKGAFTGASKSGHLGIFEVANNGTLFLDEIAELPLALQGKFLRVLDSGEVRRIGSSKPIKVDVRIIMATNRDLLQMVKEKTFRGDLYYRLITFPIAIPPLRERKEDIIPLALHFLDGLNKKYGLKKYFAPETLDSLKSYRWPGNIRELRNVVERLVFTSYSDILYPDSSIMGEAKPQEEGRSINSTPSHHSGFTPDYTLPLKSAMKAFEAHYISENMKRHGGSVSALAAELGVHPSGLYKKLESYGIEHKGR